MRVQYPKCAYGPYRSFNPIKNGVYILVEVSIWIESVSRGWVAKRLQRICDRGLNGRVKYAVIFVYIETKSQA